MEGGGAAYFFFFFLLLLFVVGVSLKEIKMLVVVIMFGSCDLVDDVGQD